MPHVFRYVLIVSVAVIGVALSALALHGLVYHKQTSKCRLKVNAPYACPSSHYFEMLSFHLASDALVPSESILLFGDSIAQSLAATAIAPTLINYGIGTDTTQGLLDRLPLYESLKTARTIVFLVGINDTQYVTESVLLSNYEKLLMETGSASIVCHAVLPIRETDQTWWTGWGNEKINRLNRELETLCEKKGGYFARVPPALKDSNGELSDVMHRGDGLHLNLEGSRILVQSIQHALRNAE